jgi:hypothetical protein
MAQPGGGRLERHVGAEGGAADDRLLHARVVQERDRLAPEDGHPVVPHLGRPVGVPVTEQVEAQHAVAALLELLGERAVHLAREQETRQENDDLVALAVLVVDQPVAFELERLGDHCGPQYPRISIGHAVATAKRRESE